MESFKQILIKPSVSPVNVLGKGSANTVTVSESVQPARVVAVRIYVVVSLI